MSKFLTPPVWYDKNGKLNEMLTGTAMPAREGFPLTNLSIGQHSVAGDTDGTPSDFGTAVGYDAKAGDTSTVLGAQSSAKRGIAIGSFVKVAGMGIGIGGNVTNGGIGIGGDVNNGGIGIGGNVTGNGTNKAGIGIGGNVTGNGIGIGGNVTGNGIGIGGDATEGEIQLGNNNTAYTLRVGNGAGTSKIGALSFDNAPSTEIESPGLYWCTAIETVLGQPFSRSAFLWIELVEITQASATNGSVTFSYDNHGEASTWKIRATSSDNNDVAGLKCYKVFV